MTRRHPTRAANGTARPHSHQDLHRCGLQLGLLSLFVCRLAFEILGGRQAAPHLETDPHDVSVWEVVQRVPRVLRHWPQLVSSWALLSTILIPSQIGSGFTAAYFGHFSGTKLFWVTLKWAKSRMPLLPSLRRVQPAFKLFGSHPHRRVERRSRKSQSNCVNLFSREKAAAACRQTLPVCYE